MTNDQVEELCLTLLESDNENEVIDLLRRSDLWEKAEHWRPFGDRESNYSSIGNQQSGPAQALVEKVVNAVDARLMSACMTEGIAPDSRETPQSIDEAVKRFFKRSMLPYGITGFSQHEGRRSEDLSCGITIAATGDRYSPCFTISDVGEGQTPNSMPETLLSLDRQNKLRIPFVQGQFSHGGTGVLEFCGTHNLQLIVSRRNPHVSRAMNEQDASQNSWGFTVVRRDDPIETEKNLVYRFLAPLGTSENPHRGDTLRFKTGSFPLFPEGNRAYSRHSEWGTTIKLYNYDRSVSPHILRRGGLLYRLELLLPEIALPVRLHECRECFAKGHRGSFDTPMRGVVARLSDKSSENLERGFPNTVQFQIQGEDGPEALSARIYASNQDFHFGPGTVKVYPRAAPNTTSFRAEPCT